ncbi:MAG TPA: L-histidine N(alpha)-methyltransferase, partial [Ktedonobacteraceae bacterium]|nr:L-histidine N(alpha)-methyltransferase [Ktedonobacteraceae bacterium]
MVQPLQHSQHPLRLYNYEPETHTFLQDVLLGLQKQHKELPSKYFYDAIGSQLFDQICMLDEYYPTRTELAILQAYVHEMADVLG